MAIIYEPRQVLNVRNDAEAAFAQVLTLAGLDFIAGNNKRWSFYLGVYLGKMAAATGIPGASATLYVVGDTVDFLLFKNPDGSDARVFLNGIAHSDFTTYAASTAWEALQISLVPGQVNRLDIMNLGTSNPTHPDWGWLAIADIVLEGLGAYAEERVEMAYDTINFRMKDSETDGTLATIPVRIPSGQSLATIQAYVDIMAPLLDAVSGAYIDSIDVTVGLTVPGGVAVAADAGILNERGGLISFETTGPRRDSFRIPAIKTSIMSGSEFSLSDTDVAALITALTGETTANGEQVQPVTAQDYQFTTALAGKKSFRR